MSKERGLVVKHLNLLSRGPNFSSYRFNNPDWLAKKGTVAQGLSSGQLAPGISTQRLQCQLDHWVLQTIQSGYIIKLHSFPSLPFSVSQIFLLSLCLSVSLPPPSPSQKRTYQRYCLQSQFTPVSIVWEFTLYFSWCPRKWGLESHSELEVCEQVIFAWRLYDP